MFKINFDEKEIMKLEIMIKMQLKEEKEAIEGYEKMLEYIKQHPKDEVDHERKNMYLQLRYITTNKINELQHLLEKISDAQRAG